MRENNGARKVQKKTQEASDIVSAFSLCMITWILSGLHLIRQNYLVESYHDGTADKSGYLAGEREVQI